MGGLNNVGPLPSADLVVLRTAVADSELPHQSNGQDGAPRQQGLPYLAPDGSACPNLYHERVPADKGEAPLIPKPSGRKDAKGLRELRRLNRPPPPTGSNVFAAGFFDTIAAYLASTIAIFKLKRYNVIMNQYLRIVIAAVLSIVITILIVFIANKLNGNQVIENQSKEQQAVDSTTKKNSQLISSSSNNQLTLKIDKTGTQAPIILNIDGNNMEEYMKALENGVAHMAKTALPGESGNAVIFGHSSYYKLKPGSYKTIFARLNRLSNGDQIQISSSDKTYIYSISEIKKIQPENTEVVEQNAQEHKLTLITCWPPTSTSQRLVVVADLVQ